MLWEQDLLTIMKKSRGDDCFDVLVCLLNFHLIDMKKRVSTERHIFPTKEILSR